MRTGKGNGEWGMGTGKEVGTETAKTNKFFVCLHGEKI